MRVAILLQLKRSKKFKSQTEKERKKNWKENEIRRWNFLILHKFDVFIYSKF